MARPTTPPYGERVLRIDPPMTGLDVWELQIKLIAWGSGTDPDGIGAPAMPVTVNGTFDRATRDAVKRFQNAVRLPPNGIVDDATFTAIDKEAALWPVLVWPLHCPCVEQKNDPPIKCRCNDHPGAGVCTGWGSGRFAGTFLLDNIPALASEKLDIYDMQEYAGVDKALLWAVRGLMHRADVPRIKVAVGYRCWQDNYQNTDKRRWRHRRSTFHLGKTVEFYHDGTCMEWGQNPGAALCGICNQIRTVAIQKCGFQARWHQAGRVSVGDVEKDVSPPSNPFAVTVSTVRAVPRLNRDNNDWVKTYLDSLQPLYPKKAGSFSYPLNLGDGWDVTTAPATRFFRNNERANYGWFPIGKSRVWHGGIHLTATAGDEVRAIADGEIVGVRGGEGATAKTLGSRNFVLVKHEHQTKVWYSLYMHLDGGAIDAASAVPWRKKLHSQTVDHILFKAPSAVFTHVLVPAPSRLIAALEAAPVSGHPALGYAAGDRVAKHGGAAAADPRTALDPAAPTGSQVIQLAAPADTYAYLQMETKVLAEEVAAVAGLVAHITGHDAFGLDHPIRVSAGELLGYVGAGPSDASLRDDGPFLHLETFSETNLLTTAGYTSIDASNAAQALDRKQILLKLKAAGLMTGLPDDVLLETDITTDWHRISQVPFRSVALKMPNQWSLDWQTALTNATPFSFMQDGPRNTLGGLMNEYRWWADVNGGPRLPASSTVFHYHPLALLFFFAFAP